MELKQTLINFGTTKQNSKVARSFVFKNTGQSDFKILKVNSSCGCSLPEWPSEFIKPNEEGTIKVAYDPGLNKYSGYEKKTFKITTNGQPSLKLIYLEGTVTK